MTADADDAHGCRAADRECLGPSSSLAAVAPLLRPEGRWLLHCLDLDRVLRALAGDDRLYLTDGHVWLERCGRG